MKKVRLLITQFLGLGMMFLSSMIPIYYIFEETREREEEREIALCQECVLKLTINIFFI